MKNFIQKWALWLVVALVGVLAIGSLVLAYSGAAGRVIEHVENYYESPAQTSSPIGPVENLGAISSPDIQSNWIKVGGVQLFAGHQTMRTATNTPCAIQGPSSTSTLMFFSAQEDVSSTTASFVEIAKSATAFATTTSLGKLSIDANAQVYVTASTTAGQSGQANVFAPNQWAVMKQTGGNGTMSPTGYCNAQWIVGN